MPNMASKHSGLLSSSAPHLTHMASFLSIRTRLKNAPANLLGAIIEGASAVERFNQTWVILQQEIEMADNAGLIDEDTGALIVSVASTLRELAESYESMEIHLHEANALLSQDLQQIHPIPSHETDLPSPSTSGLSNPSSNDDPLPSEAYLWLLKNIHNPYPTKKQLSKLASSMKLDVSKVSSFFKKLRNRSGWSRIVHTHFCGNRNTAVTTATHLFSRTVFDEASVQFRSKGQDTSIAPAVCPRSHRDLEIYQFTVLAEYRKECISRTSVLSDMSPNHSMCDTFQKVRAGEKRARSSSSLRASSSTQSGSSDFGEDDSNSESSTSRISERPSKRSRLATSPRCSPPPVTSLKPSDQTHVLGSTNTSQSHRLSSLSKLESQSLPDLLAPVCTSARIRRNSESAATAPWPYPLRADHSWYSSAAMRSSSNPSSRPSSVTASTSLLPHDDLHPLETNLSSSNCFNFSTPALNSTSATAMLSPNLDIALNPTNSSLDIAFPSHDPFSFDPSIESIGQGWDFFENFIAQSSSPTVSANNNLSSTSFDFISTPFDPILAPPPRGELDFCSSEWMLPSDATSVFSIYNDPTPMALKPRTSEMANLLPLTLPGDSFGCLEDIDLNHLMSQLEPSSS